MKTPLWEAADQYINEDYSRFHMPGHKGRSLPVLGEIARYDLTEVTGLDSLYHADGALAETEAAYTALYGTAGSFLSAGGATLCIQAMLALAAPPGSVLLAARGCHISAVNAMALLDLRPVWIYPSYDPSGPAMGVTAPQVEQFLQANPAAAAVYITSPSYYGVISDIEGISRICKKHGVPLLVDNAHGAHLRFLPKSLHPVDLGADLCCDSLHKTMPVLTGGALLHIRASSYLSGAKRAMALFGSTSPSYPIMLSMDIALHYMSGELPRDLLYVSEQVSRLSKLALEKGFRLPAGSMDPSRLTLGLDGIGYGREDFSLHLRQHKIEPEYLDDRHCILMISAMNTSRDFQRLEDLIRTTAPRQPRPPACNTTRPADVALTPRQAVFAPSESIPVEEAAGRVAGTTVTPCPPGIPILIPGEKIEPEFLEPLKNCGISSLNVVKFN